MAVNLWVATIILTVHSTSSYILLTANLEDVQAIAKQFVNSPVADQLKKIWRRASTQFNQQVQNRAERRTNGQLDLHSGEDETLLDGQQPSGYLNDSSQVERRSQQDPDITESWLTKNASYYLSSIKKLMDGI